MVAFADLIILSVKDIVAKDMGKKVILKLTCLQMALSDMCIAVKSAFLERKFLNDIPLFWLFYWQTNGNLFS